MRRYHYIVLLSLGLAALAFALGASQRRGPRTLQDAAMVADSVGFYHSSDTANGVPGCRLVISAKRLTWEQVAAMAFHDAHDPRLIGMVAVYAHPWQLLVDCDPACSAVWGELFLYGDPRLIDMLTSAVP